MKVPAPQSEHTNSPLQLEEENASQATSSFAPPVFNPVASSGHATSPLQLQPDENEPGEAIEDSATYYITVGDATIRKNSNPSSFTSNEIPQGTKVKRVRTYGGGAVAQFEVLAAAPGQSTAVGTKYWSTYANGGTSQAVSDSGNHYVTYSDTNIYNAPYGSILTTTTGETTTNQSLSNSNETAYTIEERCGAYAKVKQGETETGWIIEKSLKNEDAKDRSVYLGELKTWLNARYTEAVALTGESKTNRIKGILSLVEDVSHQIEGGTYPTISDLSTTPSYTAHDYTSFVQPELISTVRKFIEVIEKGEPEAEETTETPSTDVGGTATVASDSTGTTTDATTVASDSVGTTPVVEETTDATTTTTTEATDWNAQLGVPQFRNQSDNLAPPEVTCSPTSFTMGAERLGYSRSDMIKAIDEKLTGHRRKEYRKKKWKETKYREQEYLNSEAGQAAAAAGGTVTVPETFMPNPSVPADFVPSSEMSSTFLANVYVPEDFVPDTAFPESDLKSKWEDKAESFLESFSGQNYQKLRGGTNGNLVGEEEDLAKGFRQWGQYEDFTYFRAWLDSIGRSSIANPSSQKMLNRLHNPAYGNNDPAVDNSETITFNSSNKFTHDHRSRIQETLQDGGAVVLSYFHKGTSGGSHIVAVREVTSDGLALDDPYGQVNPEYRKGTAGDAFKDTGGTGSRSAYDWKNVPHYSPNEDDYSKRDFTRAAAEELETDERRGENGVITWKMIDESTNLLNYIVLYTRRS